MINTIIQGDCLEVMKDIPDSSIDLVVTDPPYFKVKNEGWDRQWDKPEAFLKWLYSIVEQWARVLKPNGSLYCFASPQMGTRVEVLIRERLNVLNNISWYKYTPERRGKHRQTCKEDARCFFPATERIIFAEHYGADNSAKGEAGYEKKCDELRGFVFEPLRSYLVTELKRAGMLNVQGKIAVNVACGFSPTSGGMASRHYFSQSQWQLPTKEHYLAMRTLLNSSGGSYLQREYSDLQREYSDLQREYSDLRAEYEELRRPFSVTADIPYTDVWTFEPVTFYKGKHPCEKPQDLLRHIIEVSSKPDALVLDSFAGTGSSLVACRELARNYIGIELEQKYCEIARQRLAQRELFVA